MVLNKLSLIQKPILTVDDFLDFYGEIFCLDPQDLLNLDFDLNKENNYQKLCPMLQIAELKDAEKITNLFKQVYRGSYPYKKMEDIQEVRSMIEDPNYLWFLFKINSNKVIGCFGADLEPEKKKAYLHGLVVKGKFQKVINTLKVFIGTWIYLCKTYKKNILIYHGEARTNDTASQYGTSICGMKPIAFFPNKDIFIERVESNFMIIAYFDNVLRALRKKNPRIIRQVLNSYVYTNNRYHLGTPIIENPELRLKRVNINSIRKNITIHLEETQVGNKIYNYILKDSDSYFKFYYNPFSNNIENTEFKIENLEELQAFIFELKSLIKKKEIRYFECFVSAYEPLHQKLFYDSGFLPRGYIPSWKYDKYQNLFEDQIIFNFYKGDIDKNLKLIPESRDLLRSLNFFKDKITPMSNELIQV